MPYDNQIAEKFRQALTKSRPVEERNMFGSLGFMVNGKLAVCVRQDNVMYELGPQQATEALALPYVEPMVMHNRQMKGWVCVSSDQLQAAADFALWLDYVLAYNLINVPKK